MRDFPLQAVEGYVLGELSRSPYASLGLGVVWRGGEVYFRGFGHRDVLGVRPVTADTLFGVGSLTKSFTALSTLLLEEEGRLGLTDPVSRYLPELDLCGRGVLVEHLLTHTSGIPSLGVAEMVIEDVLRGEWRGRFRDWSDFVGWVERGCSEVVSEPGGRFLYWNEGYTILGELVGRLSGRPYRAFVRERLLGPLGMMRSGFGEAMFSDPDSIEPYVFDGRRVVRARFPDHPLLDPAGGLVSCVGDMLRYLRAYLEGEGGGVLDRSLIERVWAPRVKCGLPSPFGEEYYGYGWAVDRGFLGSTLVHHSGNVGVSSAFAGFVPERGVGVVVLSNSVGVRVDYVGAYVLAALLGADPEGLGFVRYQRLVEGLGGEYVNFSGTVRLVFRQVGPTLYATFRSGGETSTFPVVLGADGSLYLAVGVERVPVEVLGGGDVLVERNRFHKVRR